MSGNGFKCRKLGESMTSRPSSVDEGNFGGGAGHKHQTASEWKGKIHIKLEFKVKK